MAEGIENLLAAGIVPMTWPMHSMTGFGRSSEMGEKWTATVEISAENRKQADIVINLPRALVELEAAVRQKVLECVSRGRVMVNITMEAASKAEQSMQIDHDLARSFSVAISDLSVAVGRELVPSVRDFLSMPGILTQERANAEPEQAWQVISPALNHALSAFIAMRASEGEHLKIDLLERVNCLRNSQQRISQLAPERPEKQRAALTKKLLDLGLSIEVMDERVAREIAIFAERCDICEELTRLDSHLNQFARYLDSQQAIGRSLDFLCQEIFRELNTIGSKASDAVIAHEVVEAKTELEKIREQAQNIE